MRTIGLWRFNASFPITAEVVAKLESLDDFVERPREVYADIIASVKDALKEMREYKIS